MKTIKLFTLLSAVLLISACGGSKNKAEKSTAYKPLLERNEALAASAEWAGKKEKVANLFKRIELDSSDINARLLLAKDYMQEARITGEHPYYYPATLAILDDVLALSPKNFEALALKASVMLSLHHFQEAKNVGEKALAINPNNGFIYGVLVDANVELGNYEAAVAISDKMQMVRPGLESYARASYLREIYGDDQGAIEAMKLAFNCGMAGTEQTAWTGNTLVQLYMKEKNYTEAKALSELILSQRPSYAFAIDALGQIYFAQGKYDSAILYYNKAIAMMPEFSFYSNLAEAKMAQGKKDEARKIYKDILPMLKEDAESGHYMDLELASLYLKLDDAKKALKHAEIAYNRRPKNIDVNQRMAQVYEAMGEKEQAMMYLKEAKRTGKKA